MISPQHLKEHVIAPVLNSLGLYSDSAVNLLLLTAAVESDTGRYLRQVGSGPALGIYQMEPQTYQDIWNNYLRYRPGIEKKVSWYLADYFPHKEEQQLPGNLYLATAMCRVHYWRVEEPLPDADNALALATYWKKYYNTPAGKGTVGKALSAYRKLKQ